MAAGPAFITGGSSGIGLAIALKLAARGHPVVLFARDGAKLERARETIMAAAPGAAVAIYCVDVGDANAAVAVFQQAIDECGTPGWAIASAGIAEPGLFLEQPLSRMQAQMDINYGGSLRFAHAVAPVMARAGGGKLVFISSGSAFIGLFGYAGYGPTKFAVRGLAETLRIELAQAGVHVTLAYPPDTDTPQLAAEEKLKPAATKAITSSGGVLSAEAVAASILRAADANRFLATPGWQMTALACLHSLIAPAFRAWQRGMVRKHGTRR
ncbi:MAG: SDR family oxidoreductase [Mesorhizobium sp.]